MCAQDKRHKWFLWIECGLALCLHIRAGVSEACRCYPNLFSEAAHFIGDVENEQQRQAGKDDFCGAGQSENRNRVDKHTQNCVWVQRRTTKHVDHGRRGGGFVRNLTT